MARRTRHIIAKDGPHPIDVHVGSRVRLRRTLLGLNQTQLGEKLGITYQQVQKYEQGVNRISASRLYQMTRILDVPVSFFFDDMPLQTDDAVPHPVSSGALGGVMLKRETLEFVRAYYRIGDPAARKGLFEITKAMANLAQG